MSYRGLLALLDEEQTSAALHLTAAQLARAFNAHLSGFVPVEPIGLPVSEVDLATAAWMEQVWAGQDERAETEAENFRRCCRDAQLDGFDADVARWPYIDDLLRRTRCNDLLMLTQPDPAMPKQKPRRRLVETLIMHSGRPVLLLPHASVRARQFDTVMLAWNGSREAARAASDAMPFLQAADQVHVVVWQDDGQMSTNADSRNDDQAFLHWLRRHGVTAEMHVEVEPVDVTEAMLSRALTLRSDLIVMGAYGHSRMREWALGGATRGMLDRMMVPVLMSH